MKGSKVYTDFGSCACAALNSTDHITVKCIESEAEYAKGVIDIYYEELLEAMQLAVRAKNITVLEKAINKVNRVCELSISGETHASIYIKMFLNNDAGYIKTVKAAILEESLGKILDGIIDVVRSEWKMYDIVFNFDACIYAKLEITK